MCGIVGAYTDKKLDSAEIQNALKIIQHRGPDDFGVFQKRKASIGMRRLSVIDVQGGHQPIFNETNQIAVVFNGEIYNYKELIPQLESRGHQFKTHTDTEVLVHLYEEYGAGMCQHLRGMFAFAILDSRNDSLFLGRDRFGKKPLYYFCQGNDFFFASELKALRVLTKSCGLTHTIRPQSIYDYLSLGVIPQPSTIYEGVMCLPPASWARFDQTGLQIQTYWNLKTTPKTTMSYQEMLVQVQTNIAEAVKVRLRSDVPLGVFLSGGIDSSIVCLEAARFLGNELQTFTVAMTDAAFDESIVAAKTAQFLGVKNTILQLDMDPLADLQSVVYQYDQPYSDSSAIPSLRISKLAREHVTVVLNGDGGDEVFGGYRRHLAAHQAASLDWIPAGVKNKIAQLSSGFVADRRSFAGFAARFFRGLAMSPTQRYLAWTTDMLFEPDKRPVWRHYPVSPTETLIEAEIRKQENLDGLETQMFLDWKFNLLSDLLVKMDIATMAHSLEARSPFLDHVLVENAALLSSQLKLGRNTKQILRDAYRNQLPQTVIQGKKRGFEVPLERWLKQDFYEITNDTLRSPKAKVFSYLDSDFVYKILDQKILRDRNWKYIVYALLVLELWLAQQEN